MNSHGESWRALGIRMLKHVSHRMTRLYITVDSAVSLCGAVVVSERYHDSAFLIFSIPICFVSDTFLQLPIALGWLPN